MTKLDTLKQKIKELEAEVARLEKQETGGRWKPRMGGKYWYITAGGNILERHWFKDTFDQYRYREGNVFQKKKIANEVKRVKDAIHELSFEPDWEDAEQEKWYIFYNHCKLKFDPWLSHYYQDMGKPYFPTLEAAQKAIPHYETLMKYGGKP